MVKYVLAFLQALAALDVLRFQPSVQAHVAVILEGSIVERGLNPGHLRSLCQGLIVPLDLVADGEALLILCQLVVVVY